MKWKKIKGYEGIYDLCDNGQLYSHPRPRTSGGYTFGIDNGDGYFVFKLTKDGKTKKVLCNILVWETFVGPIPEGYDVHHKNRNRNDNRLENLELIEKRKHLEIHKNDRLKSVKKSLSRKVCQYTLDGILVAEYESLREASRITGINISGISCCCNKKQKYKSAGGFVWQFVA